MEGEFAWLLSYVGIGASLALALYPLRRRQPFCDDDASDKGAFNWFALWMLLWLHAVVYFGWRVIRRLWFGRWPM